MKGQQRALQACTRRGPVVVHRTRRVSPAEKEQHQTGERRLGHPPPALGIDLKCTLIGGEQEVAAVIGQLVVLVSGDSRPG